MGCILLLKLVNMRVLLGLCLATAAVAQVSSTATYTYDVNGRRVEAPRTREIKGPGGSSSSEFASTINGRTAPIENVKERIVRDDASGKVIERVIQRYDLNGSPQAPEKVQIEERKQYDGTARIVTTVSRGDVNGRFTVVERNSSESRESGGVTTTNGVTERPAVNGGFEVVEKSSTTSRKTQSGSREEKVIYRPGTGGRFEVSAQSVTDRIEQGGQSTETTNQYNTAASGQMELSLQTVSQLTKNSDGSDSRQVSIYGVNTPGRAASGKAELREQQLIERRPGSGDTVVESFSVRRPTPNGGSLGDYQKISERVCSGCALEKK